MNTVLNLQIPQNAENLLNNRATIYFSGRSVFPGVSGSSLPHLQKPSIGICLELDDSKSGAMCIDTK